jgi:hypothetical protein
LKSAEGGPPAPKAGANLSAAAFDEASKPRLRLRPAPKIKPAFLTNCLELPAATPAIQGRFGIKYLKAQKHEIP